MLFLKKQWDELQLSTKDSWKFWIIECIGLFAHKIRFFLAWITISEYSIYKSMLEYIEWKTYTTTCAHVSSTFCVTDCILIIYKLYVCARNWCLSWQAVCSQTATRRRIRRWRKQRPDSVHRDTFLMWKEILKYYSRLDEKTTPNTNTYIYILVAIIRLY